MPSDTIPPPHPDERDMAFIALRNAMRISGFDVEETMQDPRWKALVAMLVDRDSQRMAENRWLTNMTHDPVALAEFLEARDA